ncbi:hypothetical protein RQP46_004829 [Phenoliferia psychrophenolica]
MGLMASGVKISEHSKVVGALACATVSSGEGVFATLGTEASRFKAFAVHDELAEYGYLREHAVMSLETKVLDRLERFQLETLGAKETAAALAAATQRQYEELCGSPEVQTPFYTWEKDTLDIVFSDEDSLDPFKRHWFQHVRKPIRTTLDRRASYLIRHLSFFSFYADCLDSMLHGIVMSATGEPGLARRFADKATLHTKSEHR